MAMTGSADDYEPIPYNDMFMDDRIYNPRFTPSKNYVISLQLAFRDALQEIDDLNHIINQSANASIMADAEKTQSDYHEALKRIATLEAEAEKKDMLLDFYKNAAIDGQNKLTMKDVIQLEKRGVIRNDTGRYEAVKPSDNALQQYTSDKKILSFCYAFKGWTNEQIADLLNIQKAETVRQYVSLMQKHCKHLYHDPDNGDCILADYGSVYEYIPIADIPAPPSAEVMPAV